MTEINQGKKQQVRNMFNAISKNYDLLNHLLSMGIDKIWRKKAINRLRSYNPKLILDIASGTGDFAIESLKLNPDKVIGIDISEEMLNIGRIKISKKNISNIEMKVDDCESLSFEDNIFDAFTVGFGVRNFENLELGMKEIRRVLKPNATGVILEFSQPTNFPIKQLYLFYFKHILPVIGRLVSKHKEAYTYLPDSVDKFPTPKEYCKLLEDIGFKIIVAKPLTFGILHLYHIQKK